LGPLLLGGWPRKGNKKMKKDNGQHERTSELRNHYGKGTKMVRLVLNKDGSLSWKKFTVK